jgi:hypothetical protein
MFEWLNQSGCDGMDNWLNWETNAVIIFMEKPFGRLRQSLEDNIKMNFNEIC